MDSQRIIMNFTMPPGVDDLEALAASVIEALPDELLRFCDDSLAVVVEDLVDETDEADLDLDDPFDLLAQYKNGKQISPGVERKMANDEDVLILYRRPILDMWCETEEDLSSLLRQIMIEELGRQFEFSEDDIDDMTKRHYQGML
ncbi:MAG: metallopeptidase family protein [Alphaproteobacteria bacterium]|nr:metallopeptidase family protein [Alphaproteobacteria bacterium]